MKLLPLMIFKMYIPADVSPVFRMHCEPANAADRITLPAPFRRLTTFSPALTSGKTIASSLVAGLG